MIVPMVEECLWRTSCVVVGDGGGDMELIY